ncbi:MAG: histidine kinase [Desulfobacterales bacterium]|nr:histidine kinase [Desulfobacterales bacterium]
MTINLNLLINLAQHASFIVAGALILLAASPVDRAGIGNHSRFNQLFLICFFGLLGIMGTYSGNQIFQSFANLRAMGIVAAGLYGGVTVGAGAGFLAGAHRFLIDPWGFSAIPCSIATFMEGLLSGYLSTRLGRWRQNWAVAALICFVGEGLHMLLVVAISRPIPDAVELVSIIALPMMVANPVGTALFIHLTKILSLRREQRESTQAQTVLDIANETVRYFRTGLTPASARKTARIIYDRLAVAAVSITDTRIILAHVGTGADHHLAGEKILTKATQEVMDSGRPRFLREADAIGCDVPGCPLKSAIVVPLVKDGQVIGTLKLYGAGDASLDQVKFNIAKGLTSLFATQFELENIRKAEQLLAQTRLRHLQAQINPHFLFNSLNTIASFCRTRPARARDLILDLSSYMRRNLSASQGMIRLEEELNQIKSYVAIEQARFGERIEFSLEVDNDCKQLMIPALMIQPLVENAIRHGILASDHGRRVSLSVTGDRAGAAVRIRDDGAGMDTSHLDDLFMETSDFSAPGGVGLANTRNRLDQLYGEAHGFSVQSTPGQGTCVCFTIPALAKSTPGAA